MIGTSFSNASSTSMIAVSGKIPYTRLANTTNTMMLRLIAVR